MTILRRVLTVTACVASLSACATTHRVTRITPAVPGEDARLCNSAVFYALPQTAVTVDLAITRLDYDPGPCSDDTVYAEKLGLKDLPTESGRRFAWSKPNLASQARPDPGNIFAIEVGPKFLQRRTQLIELTEQGLLMGASSEATSQAAEVGVKMLEFAAGISGKVAGLGGKGPGGCLDQYNEIVRLRKAKTALIAGEVQTYIADKAALELMLAKLNETELALIAQFTGIPTKTLTATVRCAFAPPAKFGADSTRLPEFESALQKDLLMLSKSQGVVVLSGDCIVPTEVLAPAGTPQTNLPVLSVRVVETLSPLAEAVAAHQEVPPRSGGLFYRIPGEARVTLLADGQVQQDASASVAQYGVVSSLPGPVVRAYTAKYDAKVYPDSGAMKTLNTSSTSVDTASLAAANAAVQPVAQALVDREKAKRAAADELTQATRERTILLEQERIRCLMEGRYPTCP